MGTEQERRRTGVDGADGVDGVDGGAGGTEAVDAGTHEVLRARLGAQARELARRAEALNERRAAVFGTGGLRLLGTGTVRTGQPGVVRDVVAVGGRLLVGANTAAEGAVLTAYGLERDGVRGDGSHSGGSADVGGDGSGDTSGDTSGDGHSGPGGPGSGFALAERDADPVLDDPGFVREFAELRRYYRDAELLRLRRTGEKLLAVFRTGPTDTRVLRWRLAGDGTAEFLDGRGDRDDTAEPAHDVTWTEATREDHVLGRHPHVSAGGGLYVSCVGGALVLKTADDTETAEGILSEPVDEPLQSLADADVAHARVGPLVLLRVRPYKEETDRYYVFNSTTEHAVRLDGIGDACRRLPGDEGIVFPGGYCLATGTVKTFDAADTAGLAFERTVRSPNGEDVLYAFRDRARGRALLLSYNVIRKEVAPPLGCRGHALFDDGTLVVLREREDEEEPARVHPVQLWHTPYTSDTHAAAHPPAAGGPLARIGNADLVGGISACLGVVRAVEDTPPAAAVYRTLAESCERVADRYHWLAAGDCGGLHEPLAALRDTARRALDEFEAVTALRRRAADALEEAAEHTASVVRRVRGESPAGAGEWIARLTELRHCRGRLESVRELRYADGERITELAAGLEHELESAGQRAVAFLGREDAFTGQRDEISELADAAGRARTVAEAEPLGGRLDALGADLRTVTEVVGGLDIADATVRTGILERIAETLGGVNRARAVLAARRRELLDHEGRAAYTAEFALLGQAATAALAAASTPESCEEQLAGLLLRIEQAQARFAAFEDFTAELDAKRAEVEEAFAGRAQSLRDARARHAGRLADSAGRILDTVRRRAAALDGPDAVHTFFATDPMAAKVRATAEELDGLGDTVRAEELRGRLKAAREEAARAQRDRADLYGDGGGTIRLGRHRFAVTTRPAGLALLPSGEGMSLVLTGTDYREPVTDPEFAATRPYWGQSLPSETPEVYRAEHLAATVLHTEDEDRLRKAAGEEGGLLALVREAAHAAYDEGHERGVHDHDAALLLAALLRLRDDAGLLRHGGEVRAAAQLFWAHGTTPRARTAWSRRATSLARARAVFGSAPEIGELVAELAAALAAFAAESGGGAGAGVSAGARAGADEAPPGGPEAGGHHRSAAAYLFEELAAQPDGFVTGPGARRLTAAFRESEAGRGCAEDLAALDGDLPARRQLAAAWLGSYARASGGAADGDLAEAVAAELCPDLPRHPRDAATEVTVEGLLGDHPRVTGGSLRLRLDEFLERTRRFREERVPGFRAYQRRRTALVARERARLRLDEFRPRPLTGFVRSRLIDEVYLPLVGDNLAGQIGAAGDAKRTDSSGLLLLLSPPGYGKTTLMEYVADRLGLMFVKIDGPALGRSVTSLDPERAPDATARQEVEKINFALAAGNNVLLYLDDIQHTSPELLQKFIPLCDAQRRIDGVHEGRPRRYDLRGKRFAVCMAGNPYTESGQRFRVPDMLANRADVWNLGDVLSGREDVFALSFVENALTANPVLAPLAGRDRADLELLVRMAGGDGSVRPDRLAHPYPPAELERITAVLRLLLAARRTVLAVNAAYIASAARSDASRTEPPFRLQGSYRDMNKLAERIVPVMNDAELEALLDDHYAAEAQTLHGEAEFNLLKLAELRGRLTPEQEARRREIADGHLRDRALGGAGQDPLARAVGALGLLADRVAAVEAAITRSARAGRAPAAGTAVPGASSVPAPPSAAVAGVAEEDAVRDQEDQRAGDGRHPQGRVVEVLVDRPVQVLGGQPAADEGAGDADQGGAEEAARVASGQQNLGHHSRDQAEDDPTDDAHGRVLPV
ncbi:DNA repair ATPase [Streptomyces fradiae]|nr:DNA repair ATPase [Streptomyces fradiae]